MEDTNDNSNNIIDISENEVTNNPFILDMSNNDSITNLLQNIYSEAVDRANLSTDNIHTTNIINNHERLRFLFNHDNSFDNLFRDINPLLMNPSRNINEIRNPSLINIDTVFSNLLSNIRENPEIRNILQESFDRDNNVWKKVLSDKGQSQLKRCLFKDSSKTNNSCPIFHTEFSEDEEIIELPCLHCFVPEAIEKWLTEEKAQCPVCRFELDSKEIKEDTENTINQNDTDNLDTESDEDEDIEEDIYDNDEDRLVQQAILDSLEKK